MVAFTKRMEVRKNLTYRGRDDRPAKARTRQPLESYWVLCCYLRMWEPQVSRKGHPCTTTATTSFQLCQKNTPYIRRNIRFAAIPPASVTKTLKTLLILPRQSLMGCFQ